MYFHREHPDILPEMACNLNPQCNFLYGFLRCNLPEDTIDMEVTVRTLKGINNFRRDHATQSSTWSLWGSLVKPFRPLVTNMEAYMEERQNFMNPFSPTQRYPDRPSPLPLSKRASPTKRTRNETMRSHRNQSKSRKMDWRHFIPAKAMIPTFSQPPALVAIPTQATITATGIFTQPSAVQVQPKHIDIYVFRLCTVST